MKNFIAELAQPMVIVGYVGQLLFFSRFLVQWIASERKKQSTVPVVFWYLSLGGGALVLCYAVWRRDQVIVLGQLAGVLVYLRNLALIRRHKEAAASAQAA